MVESPIKGRVSLATIRVTVHGQDRAFSVPVPEGPSRLVDLLPASGTIASEEARANIDASLAKGKEISCRAGCGACCRQLVAISVVEAQRLRELVDSFPEDRQRIVRERFAAGIEALEDAGVLDSNEPRGARAPIVQPRQTIGESLTDLGQRYFRLGIPCPFLEDESCSIYEDRPAVCREYHVTSPAENCERLYELPVDRLEPAVHVSELLGKLAERILGVEQSTLMLMQSLEWSEENAEALEITTDGRRLFATFMGEFVPSEE